VHAYSHRLREGRTVKGELNPLNACVNLVKVVDNGGRCARAGDRRGPTVEGKECTNRKTHGRADEVQGRGEGKTILVDERRKRLLWEKPRLSALEGILLHH